MVRAPNQFDLNFVPDLGANTGLIGHTLRFENPFDFLWTLYKLLKRQSNHCMHVSLMPKLLASLEFSRALSFDRLFLLALDTVP